MVWPGLKAVSSSPGPWKRSSTMSPIRATSRSTTSDGAGEKITAGPVGVGTKFRSAVASMGRTAEMLIECTDYDRPRRLGSTTTMQQADISYMLTFEPAGTGTRMRWSDQVRPKGAYRLPGPVITWLGRRQERRIWASLKHRMEASPAAAVHQRES
jgi:hypothetical protein